MQFKMQLSWMSSNIIKKTNTDYHKNTNVILTGKIIYNKLSSNLFAKIIQDSNK